MFAATGPLSRRQFSLWLIVFLSLFLVSAGASFALTFAPLDVIEPVFVPKNTDAYIVADDGYDAYGEYGCDDQWSEFHSSDWDVPIGVWSTNNLANQAIITYHGGLDGYTRINAYGGVITKLCISDLPLVNPKSVHVLY